MSKLTYERAKQLYTPYDEGQMRHLCALRDVEIDRLRAENAKLQKLANGYEALTATLCNERECDGCPFDGTEQIVCEHMRLQTCLSELGMEED